MLLLQLQFPLRKQQRLVSSRDNEPCITDKKMAGQACLIPVIFLFVYIGRMLKTDSKRRGGCTANDFLFLLSLLSAIPHLFLCMWIRLYLYYFPQNVNLGSQDRNSAEKPTVWVKEEKNEQENPDWKLIGKIRR